MGILLVLPPLCVLKIAPEGEEVPLTTLVAKGVATVPVTINAIDVVLSILRLILVILCIAYLHVLKGTIKVLPVAISAVLGRIMEDADSIYYIYYITLLLHYSYYIIILYNINLLHIYVFRYFIFFIFFINLLYRIALV